VIEFRLLGPLRARIGGKDLRLPGRRPQTVLARMLLEAGTMIPAEALAQMLFGEDRVKSPRNQLHIDISKIRKALGPARDVLRTAGTGYLIDLPPHHIDAFLFEELVEQAHAALAKDDPAAAGDLLDQALGLWRGPALDGLDLPNAQRQLTELRHTAMHSRRDAARRLGDGRTVIASLRTLIAEDPFSEQLHGELMLALRDSGRGTEALATYQGLRKSLADELGVQPEARTTHLYERIRAEVDWHRRVRVTLRP
jgi:DNA-binding SARP family transcriptional activator